LVNFTYTSNSRIMRHAVLVMLAAFCTLSLAAGESRDPVRMGKGRANITPEEPVLMSGYEARKTPSTGVHDELFATALCFSDDVSRVLLITTDVIGFSHQLNDEIIQEISAATGVGTEQIMLTAAHNHGAPSIRTYTDEASPENERYIEQLREKLVDISVEASENLQPVKIGIGKGYCSMNINRRAKFADGGIWLGRNQDGPCDHEVTIMKIENLEGNLVALHVNWPCHGTTGGQENYKITGDWPGTTARYLEKHLGDEVIIGITDGASGDINPIYGPGDNFNEIEAMGANLGEEVLDRLPEIETLPAYGLNALQRTIHLPGKKPCETHFPQEEYEAGPDVEIRLAAVKIGNLVFAGISGELMTELGMELKKTSPYSGTVVVTHCNGSSGYICTEGAYDEGGYEVKVTRLMPGTGETVVQQVAEMVNLL
jgi:hypothetical protein